MASRSELAVPKRPDFLLLGAHPAIDFANTLLPPPGPDIEFLQSWQDVIDWLKETELSGGQNLEVSEPEAPAALETVRNLRHAWKTTLEQIMAGDGVQPQFIKQLNRILCLDSSTCAVAQIPIPVSSFSTTPQRTIDVSGAAIRCAAIGTKWPSSGAGNAPVVVSKGSERARDPSTLGELYCLNAPYRYFAGTSSGEK